MLKKKIIYALLSMVLPLMFVACSDDDDKKNEPEPATGTIVGTWKAQGVPADEPEFVKFSEDNIVESYEFAQNSGYCVRCIYTYDATNKFLIIHYDGNEDVDIYKVNNLTNSTLSYTWIDDIGDRYSSDQYSKAADLKICEEFAKKGFTTDPDDTERFIRVNEKELNEVIASVDHVYYEE